MYTGRADTVMCVHLQGWVFISEIMRGADSLSTGGREGGWEGGEKCLPVEVELAGVMMSGFLSSTEPGVRKSMEGRLEGLPSTTLEGGAGELE